MATDLGLDLDAIADGLDRDGHAVVPGVLSPAEIDHAVAELLVQSVEWGLSRHGGVSQPINERAARTPWAPYGPATPAALLSCDLRDQAPWRRSPSVGGLAD